MSSHQRSFNNFANFPGRINAETNNYEFPQLFKISDKGKMRQWAIYVRLIKSASIKPEVKKQNWNLLAESQVPIKPSYLEDDVVFPEGLAAQVWTESGIVGMKISRSAPTYTEIKNRGKKNERNIFHQALTFARAKYLKKIEEGSSPSSEPQIQAPDRKIFPMLAKNAKAVQIEYPAYIQPKLDGLRCIAYLDKSPAHHPDYHEVVLYTRQKKEFPDNEATISIKKSLLDLLIEAYDEKSDESLYLDGELYKHGKSLQYLNSSARAESGAKPAEYYIYDLFYPSYTNQSFTHRTKLLAELHASLSPQAKKFIKLVPTHLVTTQAANDELYHKYLDQGYEGVMIRNPEGPYAKNATSKRSSLRSKNLLKRKEVYDGEFEVVGYKDGANGKEVGAIIWICKKGDKTFDVVPNLSYTERYRIYRDCQKNFVSKYQGRMLSVEYRSISESGIPQHARGMIFRDFE